MPDTIADSSIRNVAPVRGNGRSAVATPTVREIVTNGFFSVDRNWTVTEWNNAAEKLLHVAATDLLGQNFWAKFSSLLPVEFYANYHKAFQLQTPVPFEEYWAEMGAWFQGVIYSYEEKLSVSFTCSNQPTNPQQKIKVLRDLYLFVTEVTNDCLWEWDLQAKQLFWIDGGHKRVFGYPIENALIPQAYWESRIHPDDKANLLAGLQKVLLTGTEEKWEVEYRLRKMDGSYAIVHDCGHILYNDQHVALRMIGATQDITARKKAEMQLLAAEQKLSLIAKQTINAVIVTDEAQQITWVNDAFTTITGYQSTEVIGKKPGHLLQGAESDPLVVAYLNEQIKNKQPFDCKLINYTKSGKKFWVHLEGQALFNEQGKCEQFFAIQADITEQMLLEQKLIDERLQRQREITSAVLSAQEREREEIGKELHDNLNQLLAVAKLYIQMAKKSDTKRDLYLDRSTDLIANVILEVRRISKSLVVPGMHELGVLDNIRNLLSDLADIQPVIFEFQGDDKIAEIIDKKMQLSIFRIVQEQITNILKHANATHVMLDLSLYEKQIKLLISDNGKGHDLQNPVTGIGLINIRSRVAIHHGSLTISSEPDMGYTLQISLPINDPEKDSSVK
jgi:PAS domain S-box-containing protein